MLSSKTHTDGQLAQEAHRRNLAPLADIPPDDPPPAETSERAASIRKVSWEEAGVA
jgi:hypothetical protein